MNRKKYICITWFKGTVKEVRKGGEEVIVFVSKNLGEIKDGFTT